MGDEIVYEDEEFYIEEECFSLLVCVSGFVKWFELMFEEMLEFELVEVMLVVYVEVFSGEDCIKEKIVDVVKFCLCNC